MLSEKKSCLVRENPAVKVENPKIWGKNPQKLGEGVRCPSFGT